GGGGSVSCLPLRAYAHATRRDGEVVVRRAREDRRRACAARPPDRGGRRSPRDRSRRGGRDDHPQAARLPVLRALSRLRTVAGRVSRLPAHVPSNGEGARRLADGQLLGPAALSGVEGGLEEVSKAFDNGRV